MNLGKTIALIVAVLLATAVCWSSILIAQTELNREQEQLVRKELLEKIAAQEITGEFTTQNSAQIDGLQAFPRAKSVLSKENLKEGSIIAMLRYEGEEKPVLIFAASLSAALAQKTGVEYAVAFLESPGELTGRVKPATVSKLKEKVEPKISLEWRKEGGPYAYPVILTLKDGNLMLNCFLPYG